MESDFFRGDEIDKVEMFEKVKSIMIEILKGYPLHIYWGIFEGRFEDNKGVGVRNELEKDGIIKYVGVDAEGKPIYRLTPEGVKFAISLRNLDYGEKTAKYTEEVSNYSKEVLKYARETEQFNLSIIKLTWALCYIALMALIVAIIPILPNITYFFNNLFT